MIDSQDAVYHRVDRAENACDLPLHPLFDLREHLWGYPVLVRVEVQPDFDTHQDQAVEGAPFMAWAKNWNRS